MFENKVEIFLSTFVIVDDASNVGAHKASLPVAWLKLQDGRKINDNLWHDFQIKMAKGTKVSAPHPTSATIFAGLHCGSRLCDRLMKLALGPKSRCFHFKSSEWRIFIARGALQAS
mmetsp:Transcript_37194/g.73667  ORF Transcript_37194/g.73667 Transcript_37194/m.73667 type:complete len:116 (-) Transcript_37194:1714-2061(-)